MTGPLLWEIRYSQIFVISSELIFMFYKAYILFTTCKKLAICESKNPKRSF